MTMTKSDDDLALGSAACLFAGFGDRSRLSIVRELLAHERRVVDLVWHLGLAQSTVSQHLACLRDCGIVEVRPQGRASFYTVSHPESTRRLLEAAEELLDLTGHAVALCPVYGVGADADETGSAS